MPQETTPANSRRDFDQVSLKLILQNSAEEVLCLKAAYKGSFGDFYDLPGGRIDVDEFKRK